MCSICQLDFIVKVLFRFLEQLEKRSRESVVENEKIPPPIAHTKKIHFAGHFRIAVVKQTFTMMTHDVGHMIWTR